jgi:YHS domain-containing protein
MRGLFLVAGLVLAFVLLSPMLRGWRPWFLGGGGDSNDRSDQLVKDPFCGTYVVRSRAFRRESGGEALHFCSADCAARFARGERPV